MKEGSVVPGINRVPNISLDESIKIEMEGMRLVMQVPGVKSAVSGGVAAKARPTRRGRTNPPPSSA
jgi:cobalt-zinc-cadmium resistance protein CzcA